MRGVWDDAAREAVVVDLKLEPGWTQARSISRRRPWGMVAREFIFTREGNGVGAARTPAVS